MKKIHSTLIVDDNPADCYLARLVFEPTGRFGHFMEARRGDDALALFTSPETSHETFGEAWPPSLVLLDINMPGMDGFEFLERYKQLEESQQTAGVIIVMLTSSDDPRDRSRAASIGIREFISKPPTPEDAIHLAEQYGAHDGEE